jgi:predicted nucleic acid-binding protein
VSASVSPDAGWVIDANVALKWFLPIEREPHAELARAAIGTVAMRTTSLAAYEVGNIVMRQGGWDATRVAAALDLLEEICGDPIDLLPEDRQLTAQLAQRHDLTFYDASYVAIARRAGRRLLSADTALLAAGLATSLPDAFGG